VGCDAENRSSARDPAKKEGKLRWRNFKDKDLRDLSCLLRCSLLEKARLQNWHLYFFSGNDDFLICDDEAAVGKTFMLATAGIFVGIVGYGVVMLVPLSLSLSLSLLSSFFLPQSDS
jgi:hypothetical protein